MEVWLPRDAAARKRKNKMFKQRRLESPPGYFYVTRPSSVLAVAFALSRVLAGTFPAQAAFFFFFVVILCALLYNTMHTLFRMAKDHISQRR